MTNGRNGTKVFSKDSAGMSPQQRECLESFKALAEGIALISPRGRQADGFSHRIKDLMPYLRTIADSPGGLRKATSCANLLQKEHVTPDQAVRFLERVTEYAGTSSTTDWVNAFECADRTPSANPLLVLSLSIKQLKYTKPDHKLGPAEQDDAFHRSLSSFTRGVGGNSYWRDVLRKKERELMEAAGVGSGREETYEFDVGSMGRR